MALAEKVARPRGRVAIRDFQPEDYPAVVDVSNALLPDHPTTVEEERFEDEQFRGGGFYRRRLVAENPSGRIVGHLSFGNMPWAFHPDRYSTWLGVHPKAQGAGVGSALFDRLSAELEARGAVALRTWVRESMGETVAWLARRGLRELHRSWESRLDVAAFDPSRFRRDAEVPPGIAVVTLADELAVDPERLRDVHDLDNACSGDVPRVDPFTPPPFEMFRDFVVNRPQALPEAAFLAKDGDRYVGVSNLERVEALPDTLHVGFTGVRREYRGRGIAMCLKLRAIDYARGRGFRWIRTGNSSLNAPMLGINERLGFVRENVWLVMGKDLRGA